MIDCAAIRPRLAAYVDGESTVIPAEAIAAHLRGCEPCAAHEQELRRFVAAIHAAHRSPEVPAPVALRIGWLRAKFRLSRRTAWIALTAALVSVVGAAVLLEHLAHGNLREGNPIAGDALQAAGSEETRERLEQATAFRQALADGRLVLDLQTSDASALSALLSQRMKVPVELTAVEGSGLTVRGARWLGPRDGDGAMILFEGQGRHVGLVVRPRTGPLRARSRFKVTQLAGDRVVSWEHGDVRYTLVAADTDGARQGCATCHAPGSPAVDALEP